MDRLGRALTQLEERHPGSGHSRCKGPEAGLRYKPESHGAKGKEFRGTRVGQRGRGATTQRIWVEDPGGAWVTEGLGPGMGHS